MESNQDARLVDYISDAIGLWFCLIKCIWDALELCACHLRFLNNISNAIVHASSNILENIWKFIVQA